MTRFTKLMTAPSYIINFNFLFPFSIDGKKSPASTGHNQTARKHHMTYVVEPECKYLDHSECGETGQAMATVTINVIDATNSRDSCDTIGAGKKL